MKAVETRHQVNRFAEKMHALEHCSKDETNKLHEFIEHSDVETQKKQLMDGLFENHGRKQDCDCFILSRILGHPEIAGSSQWKVSDSCWLCEKWKYTLLFFDENNGREWAIQDPDIVADLSCVLQEQYPALDVESEMNDEKVPLMVKLASLKKRPTLQPGLDIKALGLGKNFNAEPHTPMPFIKSMSVKAEKFVRMRMQL
jgi:hypothetical protein